MPELFFSKITPGGNSTILLHEPVIPLGSLGHVAKRLMDPMHIQAEQVGALYIADQSVPQLEMMGGEFCVNATRAAALLLAGMGMLQAVPVPDMPEPPAVFAFEDEEGLPEFGRKAWAGEILVSGMPEAVRVLACSDARTLALCLGRHKEIGVASQSVESVEKTGCESEGSARQSGGTAVPAASETRAAIASSRESNSAWPSNLPPSMYCAARVDCSLSGTACHEPREGVCIVRMPGMVHVLIDAEIHPLPSMTGAVWRKAAAAWREACGIAHAPASGVVWHKKLGKSFRIWPAVQVRASASEHMETACGSASLALALWEQAKTAARSGISVPFPMPALDVVQPSGESLLVFLEFAPGASISPASAWIAGPAHLVAQGRAYI